MLPITKLEKKTKAVRNERTTFLPQPKPLEKPRIRNFDPLPQKSRDEPQSKTVILGLSSGAPEAKSLRKPRSRLPESKSDLQAQNWYHSFPYTEKLWFSSFAGLSPPRMLAYSISVAYFKACVARPVVNYSLGLMLGLCAASLVSFHFGGGSVPTTEDLGLIAEEINKVKFAVAGLFFFIFASLSLFPSLNSSRTLLDFEQYQPAVLKTLTENGFSQWMIPFISSLLYQAVTFCFFVLTVWMTSFRSADLRECLIVCFTSTMVALSPPQVLQIQESSRQRNASRIAMRIPLMITFPYFTVLLLKLLLAQLWSGEGQASRVSQLLREVLSWDSRLFAQVLTCALGHLLLHFCKLRILYTPVYIPKVSRLFESKQFIEHLFSRDLSAQSTESFKSLFTANFDLQLKSVPKIIAFKHLASALRQKHYRNLDSKRVLEGVDVPLVCQKVTYEFSQAQKTLQALEDELASYRVKSTWVAIFQASPVSAYFNTWVMRSKISSLQNQLQAQVASCLAMLEAVYLLEDIGFSEATSIIEKSQELKVRLDSFVSTCEHRGLAATLKWAVSQL